MSVSRNRPRGLWRVPTFILLGWLCLGPLAQAANDAADLRGTYQNLTQALSRNPFQRQLHLVSEESPSTLKGDIYAVLDYPFATVNSALNDPALGPANWCDVLMLHLNTKSCRASSSGNGSQLNLNIGKKAEQELADTYPMQFNYRPTAASPEYFRVELDADSGPLGTRDYRIVLEAVGIKENRTFLHLTYTYGYGVAGRIAMKTYLATLGRDKVGFTATDGQSSAQTGYIGGMRGVVERNAMRYYLAIDAYLGALSSAPEQRQEVRLTNWFNATERYPRQLHEVEREEYLRMKLKQYHASRRINDAQVKPTQL